jgi:hypothetical protein
MGGVPFSFVSVIDPLRGPNGRALEFTPQARYANRQNLRLDTHGKGPFCKIKLHALPNRAGVYAITVDGQLMYVGECQDLSERFGSRGYGSIAPRNCYAGGQSTNCKVNHRILVATNEDREIELWFFESPQRKPLEARLRQLLRPMWNAR